MSSTTTHCPMWRRMSSVLSLRLSLVSLFLVIFFLGQCTEMGHAEVCRRQAPNQQPEVFQCPRLFESKKKSWCCGTDTFESHCCEWSERAKEAGLALPFLQASFKYIVFLVIAIVIVISLLWVMCCLASRPNNFFRTGGGMFGHHRHQDHHDSHHGYPRSGYPFSPECPPVPPYNAYPCPPYVDQPPPYAQVAGHGNGCHDATGNVMPTAPAAVPLLSSEQKDNAIAPSTDQVANSTSTTTTTTSPTHPKNTTSTMIIPNSEVQPPFNPSYT